MLNWTWIVTETFKTDFLFFIFLLFSVDAALELVIETNNIDNGNKIQASCFHADLFKNESKNGFPVLDNLYSLPEASSCLHYSNYSVSCSS